MPEAERGGMAGLGGVEDEAPQTSEFDLENLHQHHLVGGAVCGLEPAPEQVRGREGGASKWVGGQGLPAVGHPFRDAVHRLGGVRRGGPNKPVKQELPDRRERHLRATPCCRVRRMPMRHEYDAARQMRPHRGEKKQNT